MIRPKVLAFGVFVLCFFTLVLFALPGERKCPPKISTPEPKLKKDKVILRNFNAAPTDVNAIGDDAPTVIILTPVKNAAKHLDSYFEALERMAYPKHRISLGFLSSDSYDGTHEILFDKLVNIRHKYRHVTLFQKDFNYELDPQERHSWKAQIPRRKVMGMSRNFLLTALRDEEWTVWWDVDVDTFPPTIIQDMIRWNKDVIQPNCFVKLPTGEDYPYDLNTWSETKESVEFEKTRHPDEVFLEGYYELMWTKRRYLGLRSRDQEEIVELDGVGGTFLVVRSDVHRAGANFPSFPVKHQLETEGFAKMAKSMGFGVYGLPHYNIYHSP